MRKPVLLNQPPEGCLLCASNNLVLRQSVETQRLRKLYEASFGYDFGKSLNLPEHLGCWDCPLCGVGSFYPQLVGGMDLYQKLAQTVPLYYREDKFEFDILKKEISPQDKILEIGCGNGSLGKIFPNYVGLEFNETCVATAKAAGIRVLGECLSDHMQQERGRYDVVCFFQVLEHVASPRLFLEQAMACLRPGGRLILSVPNDDAFQHTLMDHALNLPPHHLTRWNTKSIRSIASIFDLDILKVKTDTLQLQHASAWAMSLYIKLFRDSFGFSAPLLADNLQTKDRILFIIINLLTTGTGWIPKILRKHLRGESILAIFRKK